MHLNGITFDLHKNASLDWDKRKYLNIKKKNNTNHFQVDMHACPQPSGLL